MENEIENCPFCGGEGILMHERRTGKGLDGSVITCRTCGSKGQWYPLAANYSCDEKAIDAWNTRTN